MKKLLLLFSAFITLVAHGQDEFAATAFYNDFKKIQEDAQQGFIKYKGAKRSGERNGLGEEFRVKLLLPLADSGKIVVPVTGNPYAEYYFQPGKTKEEADTRAVSLRDAVITAYGKPLYAKTETITVGQLIFSNTYYFTEPDETLAAFALFKSSVYRDKKKYYLTFRVIGKAP